MTKDVRHPFKRKVCPKADCTVSVTSGYKAREKSNKRLYQKKTKLFAHQI